MKKLLLIDGHSIINRAFYGIPDLTNASGQHTNAVYGFFNIMFKILDEEKPDKLIVAFDVKQKTFRHKMFAEYKGTRKPMPEELREQVPLLQDVLKTMNITIATLPGYEADDVIGTLAKRAMKEGYNVVILSGDRDLLQLSDENILIRIPKTKKGTTEVENYYPADVLDKYQVSPAEFIDVKALMGDTADNIPGVPSVGEKTATKLIVEYGSVENIYENIEEVKPPRIKNLLIEHKDIAVLSKELATINIDSPIDIDIESADINTMFNSDAYSYMKRLEFKSLLKRFEITDIEQNHNEIEEHFKIIDDLGEAENIFKKALSATTIGIYPVWSKEENMLCISYENSDDNKDIYCILAQGFISEAYLLDKVKELVNSDKIVSFINLKQLLEKLDIEADFKSNIRDAAIAAYLLNPLKDTYNYDDIARDYMNIICPDSDIRTKGCYGAYIACHSVNLLEKLLKEKGMYDLYLDIEMPTLFTLYSMQRFGIRVDGNALLEYSKELAVKIESLEKTIYEQVGTEFNINSPKQLGEILFERMGLEGGKKTKTGYSTSADVLEKLAPKCPVINLILEYRQLTKLKSTYADGLTTFIREDGRIHTKFNQTITATGRISSTEPNLQNIPIRMEMGKMIRKVFIPEEGYVFVDADYSQIELRVLAHLSNDEALIEAYKSSSDIHRITASKVFNIPFDEVTEVQRRNAKAVNFGIVYGISSFGLSNDIGITKKEAAKYIEQYFETYKGIKNFLDMAVENAKETGYVSTMYGRVRPVPDIKSSNFIKRSFGERVAMNSPIQGTAADIIKIAMNNVDRVLKEKKMKSRLILQIHDELLIETAKDELLIVKELVEKEMKNAAKLLVELEIGMGVGDNWLEAH